VVGALGAVDARGTAELGYDGDNGVLPGVAGADLDGMERTVERAEQVGELTRGDAFIDVRVPAVASAPTRGPSDRARYFAAVPAASAK
jgi:hypothetical protein